MGAYQTFETQAIYQAIHDLALWLTPHVGKWPKWIRPTLGNQVMETTLNLFRACVSGYAAPKHQRLQYLNRASADLDGLRCPPRSHYVAGAWVPVLGPGQMVGPREIEK